ncbi:MAG: hypothetical protein GX477_05850, partial [Clostridiaceae bacterium]|nr:hypothetical protein [Clostridiaceae bacterium]
KVFIQRDPPYMPQKPNEKAPRDVVYELPAGEYCTVHGAPQTPEFTDPFDLPWSFGGNGGTSTDNGQGAGQQQELRDSSSLYEDVPGGSPAEGPRNNDGYDWPENVPLE